MRNFFKIRPCSILAIDINSSSVKILEVNNCNNTICVESYGYKTLPLNTINGSIIKDIDAVAQCIKSIYDSARLSCKRVVLAVPNSAVISKIVQINAGLNDDEIEELVIIEADKYIPQPIDEINLDFEVLGPSSQNSAMLDVLIVASRIENINSRVEAITRAGLEAVIVDVESYAVARASFLQIKDLSLDGQNKITAIIDIGSRSINLLVLRGTQLIFSREEQFGARQHYPVSLNGMFLTQEEGILPADYETKALTPLQEQLLMHIKRTLQFFYSTTHHGVVDHILLAGEVVQHTFLDGLIEERIGIPTIIANPLSNLSFSEHISLEAINKYASSLMVVCGLALRIAD